MNLSKLYMSPDGLVTFCLGFVFVFQCQDEIIPNVGQEALAFDCISLSPHKLIVRQSEAIIATHVVTLQLRKRCVHCGAHDNAVDCLACDSNHIICRTCFKNSLHDALANRNTEIVDTSGNVRCLRCSCTFGLAEISTL